MVSNIFYSLFNLKELQILLKIKNELTFSWYINEKKKVGMFYYYTIEIFTNYFKYNN